MKINYEGFKILCQAPCYELLEWLKTQLSSMYGENNVYSSKRWLYFKGTNPACLCAHLDTVHDKPVAQMYIEPTLQIIHSPQGIGGDDRCGVWIILKILQLLGKDDELPSLFFSTDEECGSESTKIACTYLKENHPDCMDGVRFFIQLDRKNEKDSVYYNCGNKEFEEYINKYGFTTAFGTRTDICILCDQWDKAGVNLSCGFEGEHHVTEVVNVRTMIATTIKLKKILKEADKDVVFDYQSKTPSYNSGCRNYYDKYGVTDYYNGY